jgi:hypothetical protein
MMKILAEKFNVNESIFETSELLETKVLKNILALEKDICSSIPEDTDVTGNASWHAQDAFHDDALVVRYPTLTREQREQIVQAYNKHYGPLALTYETVYAGGFCLDNLDGIMFNKALFCKNVLNDLAAVNEQRFDIRFAVSCK